MAFMGREPALVAQGDQKDPEKGGKLEAVAPRPQWRVIVFLDEHCPIARFHTATLRTLHGEFASRGVEFVGVFPGATATDDSIRAYGERFQLQFTLKRDAQREWTRRLDARVIPEVFVTDPSGAVYYRGRINNAFEGLGRPRRVVDRHELKDALSELVNGKSPTVRKTDVIGCLITRKSS